MTHSMNADRTLDEHYTQTIWNQVDSGGPVTFKSTGLSGQRLASRPSTLPDYRSSGISVDQTAQQGRLC